MDFRMQIDYDEIQDEYYLKFLDSDDRKKKSRYLKTLLNHKISVVTMSILSDEESQTKSQWGMYDAFVYLLMEYTGDDYSSVKDVIHSHLLLNEDQIKKLTKKQFSEFIEKLFQMCAENVGINVELVDNKLRIVHDK